MSAKTFTRPAILKRAATGGRPYVVFTRFLLALEFSERSVAKLSSVAGSQSARHLRIMFRSIVLVRVGAARALPLFKISRYTDLRSALEMSGGGFVFLEYLWSRLGNTAPTEYKLLSGAINCAPTTKARLCPKGKSRANSHPPTRDICPTFNYSERWFDTICCANHSP